MFYPTLFTNYLMTDYCPQELYKNISKEKMPTLDNVLRTPTISLHGCYKMKVWTDFRVRVRKEIRYRSSYIISLQWEKGM